MFYGLATKKVRSSMVSFRHVLEDIESLNRKAVEGQYDLTAISYHAYPHVADKYVLMASGSSIGDGYGPMLVSTRPMEPEEIRGKRIAVPGKLTSAYLALKLFEPDFEAVVTPFDKILDAVTRALGRSWSDYSRSAIDVCPRRVPAHPRPGPLVEDQVRSAAAPWAPTHCCARCPPKCRASAAG